MTVTIQSIVDIRTERAISDLAKNEKRSFSNMVAVLLGEALASRGAVINESTKSKQKKQLA